MILILLTQTVTGLQAQAGPYDSEFTDVDSAWRRFGFVRQLFDVQQTEATGTTPFFETASDMQTATTTLRGGFAYSGNDGLAAEGSLDLDILYSPQAGSTSHRLAYEGEARNRLLPDTTRQEHRRFRLREAIHRLNISRKTARWHLTLGRQAVSWGQGRLINPLDLITPSGPYIVDMEDVPGADAFSLTHFLNARDSLQLVIVPYRREDRTAYDRLNGNDTNVLLRFQFTAGETEISFLGGHHFHSMVAGAEIVLTISGAGLRGAYLGRREETEGGGLPGLTTAPGVVHQIVLGASYAFLKGKLRTNLEMFYNSAPLDENQVFPLLQLYEGLVAAGLAAPPQGDEPFFRTSGRITTRNPILAQLSIGGELTELLSLDMVIIGDPRGRSLFLGPGLGYSLSDEAVWNSSVQMFVPGGPGGEFSGRRLGLITYIRWHF